MGQRLMDIICPICAEPFDMDELHDNEEGLSFKEAYKRFRTEGCGEIFGTSCRPPEDEVGKERAAVASALSDLLGDDADGFAAMMEDYELGL